ncbi:MAG: flagellar biosynthesis protein FlhA [Planctomycetota bacterium]
MTTLASQSASPAAPGASVLAGLVKHRGLIFPASCIALLLVLLVPLPPAVLDLLLVINLTLSLVLLVTAMYVKSPLEFAVLPSLLLAVTMFRLTLNVATTRLILTAGEGGAGPAQAAGDAGAVVKAFADFVTGGSMAVGFIIFAIIFVIQFVVITKGATRISEVAARFTLDAMPGKQMAIDADLNAGLLDEQQARKRREEISQEADFYGAMDGASKFTRGDAIAGIIITLVNVAGGMYVGLVERDWPLGDTAELFTRLTIGDGLVSQVPAFITALGAGLIVTRSSTRAELGEQVVSQLSANPKPLAIAAAFLGLMAFTGLPTMPLLAIGLCCGAMAFMLDRGTKQRAQLEDKQRLSSAAAEEQKPAPIEQELEVDALELEVGYGLVSLIDPRQNGELPGRVGMIRRQIAQELGIIVPSVRIRDEMRLGPNDYQIKIRGMPVARGEAFPDQFLAMDNGIVAGELKHASPTVEPAFGLPAYWITEPQKPEAELLNYTVVEASAVVATHLTEIIRRHAGELLGRQNLRRLVDGLKERVPALVDEVVPGVVKIGEVQKVMQLLLRERVPVRDLETILETLGDYGTRTKDPEVLAEYCRNALARTICKQHVDEEDRLHCVTLDPALEDAVAQHLQRDEASGATTNTMPPQTARAVVQRVAEKVAELTATGRPAVVLCSPHVRLAMRRMLEATLPQVAVIGYNEIVPDVQIEAVAMAGLEAT